MIVYQKTIQKLSSKFRKAVLRKSTSDVWEEAVLEWEFDKYYYNDTKARIYCPCSPREIKHITVIKNKKTNESLEIDNNCAETYFGITESETIKKMVQKLSRDINLGMNKTALDYLWKNRCIHEIDYNNYEIAQGKRESKHPYSENMVRIRQEINTVLINYTKYRYKDFFARIDYAIATSDECPDFDVSSAMSLRQNVLVNGELDNYKLNGLRDTIEGNYQYYSEEKRNKIMDEHLKKGLNNDLKELLPLPEFHNKITHLTPLTGESKKLWERNKAEMFKSKKRNSVKKDSKGVDNSHLAEGLEDGTEDSSPRIVVDLTGDLEARKEFWKAHNSYMEKIKRRKVDYYSSNIDYSTEEWAEYNFRPDDLTSRNNATLTIFFNILYNWVVAEMKTREIEPKECSDNMEYSLKEVICFINISKIVFFYQMNKTSSFYQAMTSVSIKYSYQLLDWLIRNSNTNVKANMLGELESFLKHVKLKLIHNEKITRLKSLI